MAFKWEKNVAKNIITAGYDQEFIFPLVYEFLRLNLAALSVAVVFLPLNF